ncbi:MAG TPA: LytTR family DNA-binding domain-containing protein [Chryseosolibacter sp.]
MKPIQCLLVDDEPPSLEILRTYISNTPGLQIAGECHHAVAAFEFLQSHSVDLILLDMNMPRMTGMDFLRALKNPPKVIITTAYRDFAVDGYELGAVDYLLKPFSLDRFWKAIQRIQTDTGHPAPSPTQHLQEERSIYVRSDRKMVKVPVLEILYVESLKDYVKIVLKDRQIITKQTITAIEEMLPEKDFARVHRSFIVSLRKVDSYSPSSAFLGKTEIPIGPLYRQQVRGKLQA